jgi:O-antigen/teichoic acid export membrane protein
MNGSDDQQAAHSQADPDGPGCEVLPGPQPAACLPASSKHRSLRRGFSWAFVANAAYSGSRVLIYVVLTRLVGDRGVGQYSLSMSIAGPVFLLAGLNLQGLLATDHKEEYSFAQYFGLRLLTSAIGMAVFIVAIGVIADAPGAFAVLLLVGAARGIETMADLFSAQYMHSYRFDWMCVSKLLRGLVGFLALLLAAWAMGHLGAAVAAMGLTWVAVMVVYDLPRARRLSRVRPQLGPRVELARLARQGLPTGIAVAIVSLGIFMPRYFIVGYMDEASLGRFTAVSQFLMAMSLVSGPLAQACAPRLASDYHEHPKAFRGLVGKLVALSGLLGAIGVVVAWLFGKPVLGLLYGRDYEQYHDLLVLFVVVGTLSVLSLFMGTAATAARQLKAMLYTQLVAAGVLLVGCWWLVPARGLQGAALAMVVSSGLLGGMRMIVVMHGARRRLSSAGTTVAGSPGREGDA